MSTALTNRINISLSDSDKIFLENLSKREKKPLATKARELLEMAMEITEDYHLEEMIKKREKESDGKLVKMKDVCWD